MSMDHHHHQIQPSPPLTKTSILLCQIRQNQGRDHDRNALQRSIVTESWIVVQQLNSHVMTTRCWCSNNETYLETKTNCQRSPLTSSSFLVLFYFQDFDMSNDNCHKSLGPFSNQEKDLRHFWLPCPSAVYFQPTEIPLKSVSNLSVQQTLKGSWPNLTPKEWLWRHPAA